jgi:hypothetical protein
MITANLAGSSLQPSHLRGEREKFKSHSRLNLNEDNSDSASNKQNPEDWNPNDTNSDHGRIISEHMILPYLAQFTNETMSLILSLFYKGI